MKRDPNRAAFCVLLAILALYWSAALLGATGSYSHAFGAVFVVALAAWFGWLIRDCEGEEK